MKDFVRVYAVRATAEAANETIVSYGSPFLAENDESAITAVRNTIKEHIETQILDEKILKHHRIYCIGRYYFARRSPFSSSRPKPRRVFDCENFIMNNVQKEDVTENA